MSEANRFYRPGIGDKVPEDYRKAEVERLGREIARLHAEANRLHARRMDLMTHAELHGEDRHPNW